MYPQDFLTKPLLFQSRAPSQKHTNRLGAHIMAELVDVVRKTLEAPVAKASAAKPDLDSLDPELSSGPETLDWCPDPPKPGA